MIVLDRLKLSINLKIYAIYQKNLNNKFLFKNVVIIKWIFLIER